LLGNKARIVSQGKGEMKMAYKTEKRRAKRIIVPTGSTALFLNGAGSMEKSNVQDISAIGMLLCEYSGSAKKHPADSLIYNIYVDIPSSESNSGSRINLLVDGGKVVRSFFDQASETVCYGIEFNYESSYVKEKIERLVNNT